MASVALAPLLVLQLGVLWLIRTGAETEVPAFVIERLQPRLRDAGISCSWSSARISLSGRIELTDASVGASSSSDPVFEAGRLTVVLDPVDLLLYRRVRPVRLWLDRGRLLCPALLSPTGRREIALDRVRAALRREGDRLIVETLQADCAGIPLVVHGRVLPAGATGASAPPPRHDTPAPATPAASPAASPLRAPGLAAARLVALRPWLSRLSGASMELAGEEVGGEVRLRLTGLADALSIAEEGVSAERLRLDFGLRWDAAGPHPSGDAVFALGSLRVDRGAAGGMPAILATCGAAQLRTAFGKDWELPVAAHIVAHRPEVNRAPFDRIELFGERLAAGRIRFHATGGWCREYARVAGVLDPAAGAVDADFEARVHQDALFRHPAGPRTADLPAEFRELRVPGAIHASGHVAFAPGWKFTSADIAAETGGLHLPHVDVLSARVAAHVTPETLTIPLIEVESTTQRAKASVVTGYKATSPYRIIVCANAYPEQVRPYVGKWWDRIWADLALTPGCPALVDIDVSGQWDGLPYEHIYAAFSADKLSYRKETFDRVTVRLLEEPKPVHRISIFDMRMRNTDGTHASGRLEWRYAGPEHKRESCRFHFLGRMTKDVGVQIAGDEVVAALKDLKVGAPAEGEVTGLYHGVMSATPGRDQLQVRVAAKGPFEAWGLPGEDFSGLVLLDGSRLEVRDAALRYAGGEATGRAWLNLGEDKYRLSFESTFKDCERDAFFAGLARLKSAPAKPAAPTAPANPAKTPAEPQAPAYLSGDIKARVILPDMDTFDARGEGVMTAPGLAALPWLGALSRWMESVGVEAGTYRFDSIDGRYFVREGAVWFPDLKVRGKDAVLDVRGRYALADGALSGRAVLVPNKSDTLPLFSWAKNLATSSTKLFPVEIHGTLDEPKWKIDPTPSAMVTKQRNDSLGLPPPPKPDDGKW